jgi:hypothetical protein
VQMPTMCRCEKSSASTLRTPVTVKMAMTPFVLFGLARHPASSPYTQKSDSHTV